MERCGGVAGWQPVWAAEPFQGATPPQRGMKAQAESEAKGQVQLSAVKS